MKTFEIDQQLEELAVIVNDAKNLEDLKQIKAKYFLKSEFNEQLKNELKITEDKKQLGQLINYYNKQAFGLIETKKQELLNNSTNKYAVNPLLNSQKAIITFKGIKTGIIHPLTKIQLILFNYFEQLNYEYLYGEEVETEGFNFDALNVPNNHPARQMQDTFYLEDDLLLRTHTTNTTARKLAMYKTKELSSFSIGNVFRNDDNDATHSFQFMQVDIFSLAKWANITTLKYTINGMLDVLFAKHLKTRYRLSYFPFTEPSFEVDIECLNCQQKGCNVCKQSGWIEILGCGMLHPKVFSFANRKKTTEKAFAAGIGIERIAMLKYRIDDIRIFYNNDQNKLSEIAKQY